MIEGSFEITAQTWGCDCCKGQIPSGNYLYIFSAEPRRGDVYCVACATDAEAEDDAAVGVEDRVAFWASMPEDTRKSHETPACDLIDGR